MFKTVLAHLTGTDCDATVLATALQLVRPFAGHVECLRVVQDPAVLLTQAMPFETGMGMTSILADVLSTIEQQSGERTKRARLAMSEFCKAKDIAYADSPPGPGGVSAVWLERKGADDCDAVVAAARFHDLVVLAGGPERPGRLPAELLGNIVVSAGRPVVLAPQNPSKEPILTVAIAWKDTAEAARALTAAMPLFAKAQKIEILSANENDGQVSQCLDCSESIVQQLRWHGLNATTHFILPAGRSIPDAVLETAHGLRADLLVMGGYGHGRLREFVFGGFTRRILEGADLPVFLFH
jgi:nucleotide-binding universal stress UspA family protein